MVDQKAKYIVFQQLANDNLGKLPTVKQVNVIEGNKPILCKLKLNKNPIVKDKFAIIELKFVVKQLIWNLKPVEDHAKVKDLKFFISA